MRQPRLLPPAAATALIAAAALAGCSVGDRGLDSGRQPLVARDRAFVPNCPDWSDAGWNAREGNAANWGCASAADLAAMIADPQDLLHGKADAPSNADTAVKAVGGWRTRVSAAGGAAPAAGK